MEKNNSSKFILDTFLASRDKSFQRIPEILTSLGISIPTMDLVDANRIYDGLHKEIPDLFGKEDLLRNTSRLIDLSQALLRNYSKLIGALIKQKELELPYYEGVTVSFFVDNYNMKFPTSISRDRVTSQSFIIESARDKIERRVLIVLQNEQEEINSVIEKSVNESSTLYALILTVSPLDDILNKSLGSPNEPSDKSSDESSGATKLEKDISKINTLSGDKHSLRMTIPSDTDSLDDALNCVFSWITEVELLPDKSEEQWTKEGEQQLESNELPKAIASLYRAINLNPTYVRALHMMGRANLQMGKFDESLSFYDRALKIEVNDTQLWNGKGEALSNLGRYGEALECFNKALEIQTNWESLKNKGQALAALERYGEALECFNKALEMNPTSFDGWYSRAWVLFTTGKYRESVTSYDKALEIDSNKSLLWYDKGAALMKLKRYEQAIECFSKAITIDNLFSTAWTNRGLALCKLERYDEAIKSYDKAIELFPRDIQALSNKGNTLVNLKRLDEGMKLLEYAISETSKIEDENERSYALSDVAVALAPIDLLRSDKLIDGIHIPKIRSYAFCQVAEALESSDIRQSIEFFDKALQISPRNLQIWRAKGEALISSGEFEDAIFSLDKALEIDDKDADSWKFKGIALGEVNRNKESILCLEKSLQLENSDPDTWYNIARSNARLGKNQVALEKLEKSIELGGKEYMARATKEKDFEKLRINKKFKDIHETTRENLETGRLGRFLDDYDLHLLSDATEGVSVGSIYKKSSGSKARRIGNVTNFISPSITLPEPKKGFENVIIGNFREKRRFGLITKFIVKFISTIGLNVDSNKDQILEVNYDKVTYEETDLVVFSDLLAGHHVKKTMIYDPDSEYYLVTKIVKSGHFAVTMRLTKDLKTSLVAKVEQPPEDASVKMAYATGKLDEIIATYVGERPLVFAARLVKLVIDRTSSEIVNLQSLSKVLKLLKSEDRIWEEE